MRPTEKVHVFGGTKMPIEGYEIQPKSSKKTKLVIIYSPDAQELANITAKVKRALAE